MATWYIDFSVSTSGSGTEPSPWKSVSDIVYASLAAGDVIKIDKNTPVVLSTSWIAAGKSGTSTAPIRVVSADKNSGWSLSAGAVINGNSAAQYGLYFNNVNHWHVWGVDWRNTTSYGVVDGGTGNLITNFIIQNSAGPYALYLLVGSRAVDGTIRNCSGAGVYCTQIMNVLIDGVSGVGVFLNGFGNAHRVVVDGASTAFSSGGANNVLTECIAANATTGIFNNNALLRISDCSIISTTIGLSNSGSVSIENCNVFGVTTPINNTGFVDGAGIVTAVSPVVDHVNGDFSNSAENNLRSVQKPVGAQFSTGPTTAYITAGLPPQIVAGGGGSKSKFFAPVGVRGGF